MARRVSSVPREESTNDFSVSWDVERSSEPEPRFHEMNIIRAGKVSGVHWCSLR